MTDIVALLREAAGRLHPADVASDIDLRDRLTAAADEFEASAEYALFRWMAGSPARAPMVWRDSVGPWTVRLSTYQGERAIFGDGDQRADAIRAALKAWEER